MLSGATYCGQSPLPAELLGRFNLDPIVIAALIAAFLLQRRAIATPSQRNLATPAIGWGIAAFAFLSPLCALSVALFSARVGQHMLLMLAAAPLIASGFPATRASGSVRLWLASAALFVALWFWHMPVPYAATFRSTPIYWAMHLSLFGSAVWLWTQLFGHSRERAGAALAAGAITSIHMGLLGAVITFAAAPMYSPHFATAQAWGLSALADQQLGGVLMWVPGCALFLAAALRSFLVLWQAPGTARA